EPDDAPAHLHRIDQALAIFADGGIAHATSAHHVNPAHFVSASLPQTLVLAMDAMPPQSMPLIHTLSTQLAALQSNGHGREMLIAIEADAARDLSEEVKAKLATGGATRLLIQSENCANAERLL